MLCLICFVKDVAKFANNKLIIIIMHEIKLSWSADNFVG